MTASKWESKLPLIKKMAGLYSTEAIAEAIGTNVNNLHKICHRNNISLPRDESTYKGGRKSCAGLSIDEAINFLTDQGYRVIKPDLFKGPKSTNN